jgi:ribonuclease BN (tRNA processing enzyme)
LSVTELRLVALGIGDAFSALYYSTSLALVAPDGRWLLVDCAHPIRKVLREASLSSGVDLDLSRMAGLALTHLHADHASGLEGLGYYFKYILPTLPRPDLFLGPKVLEALRLRKEAELFNLVPVAEACQAGPFTLEARDVTHGDVPACAFRIGCGGRSVGHSGDTCFDPELIAWLAAADLVIHEAGAYEEPNTFHTAYGRLAALPEPLRRKMRLVHCADDFAHDPSVIEPLRQGQVYAV